jgi:hypothetical protein
MEMADDKHRLAQVAAQQALGHVVPGHDLHRVSGGLATAGLAGGRLVDDLEIGIGAGDAAVTPLAADLRRVAGLKAS